MKLVKRTIPIFLQKENKFYSVSSFLCELVKVDHSKQRFSSNRILMISILECTNLCVCEKAFTVLRQRGAHCCCLSVSVARIFVFSPRKKKLIFQSDHVSPFAATSKSYADRKFRILSCLNCSCLPKKNYRRYQTFRVSHFCRNFAWFHLNLVFVLLRSLPNVCFTFEFCTYHFFPRVFPFWFSRIFSPLFERFP